MDITFKWIGGATWILDVLGVRIACDPVLCPAGTVQNYTWFRATRLDSPVFEPSDFNNIDLWLLTHSHEDHLDGPGVQMMGEGSGSPVIVGHQNTRRKLDAISTERLDFLEWGAARDFSFRETSVRVEAVPAIHGVNPVSALFAGGVNGYLLNVVREDRTVSVYVTGDTVLHRKVLHHLKGRSIDLIIPNMGAAKKGTVFGSLTMSARMLKKLMEATHPEAVLPVHFGTFDHYAEPVAAIQSLNEERIRILRPGESCLLSL